MRAYLLALAMSAAALPAYAQTQAQPQGQGQAAAPGAQRATQETQQFVSKAAVGDMFEIQSSKMALDKASTDEVEDFAQRIIDDHTKSSNELKSLAKNVQGVEIPTQLDAKHKDMVQKLQSASQGQFNQLYRTQQLQAHKEAIQLFQQYAQNGDNAQLRQFAEKTLPKLKQHQQMAQDLPQEPGKVGQSQQQGTSQQAARQGSQPQQQQQGSVQQGKVIGQLSSNHILGSDLRGTNVYGGNGENIGEIDDIVLDRDGRAVALIVGVGGFLGIGEKNVAIPFDAVEISEGRLAGTERLAPQPARPGERTTDQQAQPGDRARGQQTTDAGTANPTRVVLHGMTREQLEAAPSFENAGRNR